MKRRKRKYATDRASPKNGAQEPRPTPVASGLGLPCPGRARLKKLAPIRIRNIAFTERWRKLANVLVLVVNVFLQAHLVLGVCLSHWRQEGKSVQEYWNKIQAAIRGQHSGTT
ncbi:unnamed protein product [Arctia plantaginis]|uniref:Uncharacterized protein n=1 Tax=Arctia plantaginis TaxID=874455 RepID=A0A8S0Z244_ARCPL|nr:unnamed protein product [Arctia plantaginis]